MDASPGDFNVCADFSKGVFHAEILSSFLGHALSFWCSVSDADASIRNSCDMSTNIDDVTDTALVCFMKDHGTSQS